MTDQSGLFSDSDLDINERLYRMSRRICRALLPLFAVQEIVGAENIPKDAPAILASKHSHWFDLVATGCFIDRMMYTFSKPDFFDTSTTLLTARRWWMKKMGAYSINRKKDEIGFRPSDVGRLLQPVKQGALLLLYPEGTRVQGHVGELEKGLAATAKMQAFMNSDARLPIIPLSPGYSKLPFGSFQSFIPFWERVKVSLVVGEPLYYNGETIKEFTRILKEKLTECYNTAGSLVTA
jgi:1-acyl-sn-glycerol-3-phosphate acyltransferase